MKHVLRFLGPLFCVALLTVGLPARGQNESLAGMDSVEVGLLTCSPHNEVYSLYGHSALHWHDLRTGQHWVFNYGVFDYRKPHFVWRFIMGQTDYRLEATTALRAWCDYYRHWGSSVEEQVLNLTAAEKLRLQEALALNLRQPEYRYNFFYDNCSTRPRDMIERSLDGTVHYALRPGYEPSFRQMIRRCTKDHPWATFGNDLLLGLRADQTTTQRERQFLPENLMWDFDHATVERSDGSSTPLVQRRVVHVPLGQPKPMSGFPLSPLACTLLLLLVSLAIAAYEHWWRLKLWWWDALLMTVTGLAGCLLVLMFFSEHPATSSNLQVLVLNPLALLFLPAVLRRRRSLWFRLSLVCLLAFLLGALWQDYAEGMEIVALCLLLRCWTHRHDK